jgi:hypothetical protein
MENFLKWRFIILVICELHSMLWQIGLAIKGLILSSFCMVEENIKEANSYSETHESTQPSPKSNMNIMNINNIVLLFPTYILYHVMFNLKIYTYLPSRVTHFFSNEQGLELI